MADSPKIAEALDRVILEGQMTSVKNQVSYDLGDVRLHGPKIKDMRDLYPYLKAADQLKDFDYLIQLFTVIPNMQKALDTVKQFMPSSDSGSTDGACQSTAGRPIPPGSSSKKEKSGRPMGQPADLFKSVYELNPSNEIQGLCVIFNNKTFEDNADRPQYLEPSSLIREGTDNDEKELTRVLQSFGLKIKVYKDLTCDEMRTRLKYYGLKDHSKSKYKMFIVCFLSHGEANHIYGVDWKQLCISDILPLFSKDGCKSLDRIPKLFFIQACQGSQEMDVTDGPGNAAARYNIEGRDMFLFFPTLPDFEAHRNIYTGGWFIQILCKNLDKYGDQDYFHEIVQQVKTDVSQRSTIDNRGQHAFDINGLTKRLKFKRIDSA